MNASLPNTPVCPKCGRTLDAYAPEGECPRCMLVAAVADLPPAETAAGEAPSNVESVAAGILPAVEPGVPPGGPATRFGDYELLEEIGRGGMGVVHKARQLSLGRIVAIKLLPFNATSHPESVKRFRAEASAAAGLQHPNIVAIHEVGVHQGQHYFAMDLIDGQNLAQVVAGGPLPAKRAAGYLKTIAEAIEYAHQRGILHRDLKPSNVLLDAFDQPRVTDFGLARRLEGDSSLTLSGQVVGSPSYMPPEQAGAKGGKVSRRSDVYALGAMLYHLVSGRAPFVGDTVAATLQQVQSDEPISPRLLNPSVPRDLATICLKCLEKEPARRYDSAQALANELDRSLRDEPILARPAGRWERAVKWARRKPAVAALAALVMVVTLAGVAGILWQWREAETARDDATKKLWGSYLAEAQARRWSGRPGQRFESLDALARAAAMRPALELRNEAIACLALLDARRTTNTWPAAPGGTGLAFDAALERYAHAEPNGDIRIRRVSDDAELDVLPTGGAKVWYVPAFSPDGRWLAATYVEHGTRIWDLERREVRLAISPMVRDRDFSPNSRRLATVEETLEGPSAAQIIVRELADGKVVRSWPTDSPYGAVRFDPSGVRLAAVLRRQREVQILDVASGQSRRMRHESTVEGVAWHPDGVQLATVCADRQVHLWNTNANDRPAWSREEHTAEIVDVAFNRAGDLLASGSWDGTVRLWTATGQRLLTLPVGGEGLQFGPDSRRLAVNPFGSARAQIWEIAPAQARRTFTVRAERKGPYCLDFSPDGRLLAAAGLDFVWIFDVLARREVAVLPIPSVLSARFGPADRPALFTCGRDTLRRWPLAWGPAGDTLQLGPPERLGEPGVTRFSLRPDGGALAAVGGNRWRLIIPGAPKRTRRFPMGFPSIVAMEYVAMSADGKWFATGARKQNRVQVWETQTGALVKELPVSSGAHVVFSPDNRWLVTGTGFEFCFWTVGAWEPARRIAQEDPKGSPLPVAFSADGRILAAPFFDRGVRLIDLASGMELATLAQPGLQTSTCLCFSRDGSRLATADESHTIHLWDLSFIRAQLAAMKLDWSAPPLPAPRPSATTGPIAVKVVTESGSPPLTGDENL